MFLGVSEMNLRSAVRTFGRLIQFVGLRELAHKVGESEELREDLVQSTPLLVIEEVLELADDVFLLFCSLRPQSELSIILESVDGLAELLELLE